VAANVNKQAPPRESGTVLNRYDGHRKSVCGGFHQLKEGLNPMQDSRELGAVRLAPDVLITS